MNKIDLPEDDLFVYEEEEEPEEGETFNLPLDGSPLYPKVYIGESAKPLQGQFNQSEYIDDNITRTWTGLLNSFYG